MREATPEVPHRLEFEDNARRMDRLKRVASRAGSLRGYALAVGPAIAKAVRNHTVGIYLERVSSLLLRRCRWTSSRALCDREF